MSKVNVVGVVEVIRQGRWKMEGGRLEEALAVSTPTGYLIRAKARIKD